MLKENKRFLDYLGVTTWHNAGYFGQRVTSATGEAWSLNEYNPNNLCSNPFEQEGSGTGHPIETAKVFFEIAPKTHLVMLPSMKEYINGKYESVFLKQSLDYIKKNKVSVMFTSRTGDIDRNIMDVGLEQVADKFTYFMSAGNDGDDSYNRYIDCDYIYGVGAYNLTTYDNKPTPASYSSESEFVDYCTPAGIYIPDYNDGTYPERYHRFDGTSCSAPVIAGMATLVNDFFIHKTGKPLSSKMMHKFMLDNCTDIHTKGFDTKTGWGVVRLPDPCTIDIAKYSDKKTIESFDDYHEIGDWAKESVEKFVNLGMMTGTGNGKFSPNKTLTRAEIAVICNRILDMCEK